MLTELDLNLLLALDALLSEKNVTRAGEKIGLSQPGMSAALSRLRRFFDDDLLVRAGRDYELTPLAEELCAPLEELVVDVQRLLDQRASFDPATARRTFSIRLSDYAMLVLVHPLLEKLEAEAPGVDVQFTPVELAPPPEEPPRDVDLTIMPSTYLQEGEIEELFTDKWMVAASVKHPELGNRISRRQFGSLRHVQFQVKGIRGHADQHLDELGVERHVAATVGNFVAALFLVQDSDLITLTQERLGCRLADAAQIKLLEPPYALPRLIDCMWWRAAKNRDPGHVWLRRVLSEVAAGL